MPTQLIGPAGPCETFLSVAVDGLADAVRRCFAAARDLVERADVQR